MTLAEILAEIDLRYPNKIDDTVKIDWINMLLKQIYKHIPNELNETFTTVADQALYELADDIKVENIISPVLITVSDTTIDKDTIFHKYYYAGIIDTLEGDFGNRLSGYKYYDARYNNKNEIGIYPVPKTDNLICTFIYRKYPELLTADDLTVVPDIQEEWHEIFVYECIIKAALSGNNPDTNIANMYVSLRNAIMRDIIEIKYTREPEYRRTTDVMKRGKFSRYYNKHPNINVL